jgi:hypothetical protein
LKEPCRRYRPSSKSIKARDILLSSMVRKKPEGKDWTGPNGSNYAINDPVLAGYLAEGHNYGVVCGIAGITVPDLDDPARLEELGVMRRIPKTLQVQTGRGGRHVYFDCPELDHQIGLYDPELKDEDGGPLHLGEIQSKGQQVVGPGSIHPNGNRYEIINDAPIMSISKADLLKIFDGLILTGLEDPAEESEARRRKAGGSSIGDNIPIDMVAWPKDVKERSGSEVRGSHPLHGSKSGKNFSVNVHKNCWHCFRHKSGGDSLVWLAVGAGLIRCEDARPGCMDDRELFKQVLKIARDKGFYIPDKPTTEGEEITEEELQSRPKTFNPRLDVHLEPGNFVSKYMVYAKTTSDAYEEYHFASGLVLLSVAADRQIVISMRHGDIYPNIWIFPIGDSTISRKTTAHKLCKLILKTKFPKKSLPSSFSPEALMDAIAATPRCYYLKDEAGSLLASMCKDYMQETRDFLAEIYECDNYYRKLKKSECEIIDPYITQFLMTTPDNLKEYTSPLDLTSGWLLRYLWMYPNYPKDWKPFAEKDSTDFDRYTTIYGEYNRVIEKLAIPRSLSMTTEAMKFFQTWQRAVEEQAMKDADNITKALAGRLMTYAVKMAALFTIGREDFDENSKIELPHIQEASRLVTSYFLPIGKIIIDEVARAESQNAQDKIIGTLKRYNGRIKQRDLLRVLHMKLKDVEEAIEALILSEEIEKQIVKINKSEVLYYVLSECHSVIVSHNPVYKLDNTQGSLYTQSRDTWTLGHLGQVVGSTTKTDFVETVEGMIGPNPRKDMPTPSRPDLTKPEKVRIINPDGYRTQISENGKWVDHLFKYGEIAEFEHWRALSLIERGVAAPVEAAA